MESPGEACVRLIRALEQLAVREASQVREADYAGLRETQQCAQPVVDRLAALAAAADPDSRARVAALAGRRAATAQLLETRMAATADSLQRARAALQRLARVAPAYRRPERAPPRQLQGVG